MRMSHEQAVEMQYQHLKEQMKNKGGVEQGYLCYDNMGNVVNRVGRQSQNPPWYREFYAKFKKKPNNTELRTLAEKHIKEGYHDELGYIPPFHMW